MRKSFFTIPVVLALLVSAVFPVQKAMAVATTSWTCVTGGATVTWAGLAPGGEILVTTPTGNTFIESPPSPASGTRTFLNGNGTYLSSEGGSSSSIICPTTATTPTTVTSQDPSAEDLDGDGLTGNDDPCPKDKNAGKDKNGYCPSDETGKRLTNGSIVVYDMNDSTEIQFYTGDGKKLGGVDQSSLEDFASSPLGTTINLPTRDGKSYSLTNGGNGRFTGKYDGKDFNFYLPGLVKKPLCDPAARDRAQVRADDLIAAASAMRARVAQARADAEAAARVKFNVAALAAAAARADIDAMRAQFADDGVIFPELADIWDDILAANATALAFDAATARAVWAIAQAEVNAAGQAAWDALATDVDAADAAANAAQAVADSLRKNCP